MMSVSRIASPIDPPALGVSVSDRNVARMVLVESVSLGLLQMSLPRQSPRLANDPDSSSGALMCLTMTLAPRRSVSRRWIFDSALLGAPRNVNVGPPHYAEHHDPRHS